MPQHLQEITHFPVCVEWPCLTCSTWLLNTSCVYAMLVYVYAIVERELVNTVFLNTTSQASIMAASAPTSDLERLEVMVGARQRSANWPKPMVDTLVAICNKRYDVIEWKFSMSVTGKGKNDAWQASSCHGCK